MKRRIVNHALSAAALAAAVLLSSPAAAQDKKIVLRVADHFPTGHFLTRYGTKPWMEQVTKATHGEVQFEHYPAEQLGKAKDLLSLMQTGVADVVMIAPSNASDKMPLTAALELPGMFDSSCQGSRAFSRLAAPAGILGQQEYGPNGARVLFAVVLPPYQLVSAKRRIDTLADVEGMKLRVLGGAMELAVRRLKAVGVKMPAADAFEAISRGTLDGAVFSYGATATYNIPAAYATSGSGFGAAAVIFIVSENRWKQLPEHVKKAMADAGVEAGAASCAGMDKEEASDLDKLKARNMTVVRWSAADKAATDAVLADVARDWAAEVDKRGKPGSEVLRAVREARGETPR